MIMFSFSFNILDTNTSFLIGSVYTHSIEVLPKNTTKINSDKVLTFMHIPKTGGTSFYNDMLTFGINFSNESPTGNEFCFHPGMEYTFIRNPRSHILSQYTMCRYSNWGKKQKVQTLWTSDMDMFEGFEVWLDHFTHSPDYLNCYYPYNLQTRALLCEEGKTANAYSRNISYNVEEAFEHLKSLRYGYGILEDYDNSVCEFIRNFIDKIPHWCDMGSTMPWKEIITHEVPKHSYADVPEHIKAKAEPFIQHDLRLYNMAKAYRKKRLKENSQNIP